MTPFAGSDGIITASYLSITAKQRGCAGKTAQSRRIQPQTHRRTVNDGIRESLPFPFISINLRSANQSRPDVPFVGAAHPGVTCPVPAALQSVLSPLSNPCSFLLSLPSNPGWVFSRSPSILPFYSGSSLALSRLPSRFASRVSILTF